MRTYTIPYDITCDIIDAVGALKAFRAVTLRACALTSRAWLRRARFHLYRDVWVWDNERMGNLNAFASTISDSPPLGTLVRCLRLEIDRWGYDSDESVQSEDPLAIPSPFPPHVVRSFTNIDVLTFEFSFGPSPSPAPVLAFITSFSEACPSIKELSILNVSFESLHALFGTVASFPQIIALALHTVDWIVTETHDAEEIRLSPCHDLLGLQLAEISLMGPLLALAPPTLRRLTMGPRAEDPGISTDEPDDTFHDLARLEKLETLTLNVWYSDSVEWLLPVLSRVRCTELRTLSLSLHHANAVRDICKNSLLDPIDELLSKEPFLNLRMLLVDVMIQLKATSARASAKQNVKDCIVTSLHRCRTRGIHLRIRLC